MKRNFSIKKQKPSALPVGKSSPKLVFGFSELKEISYPKALHDGKFFVKFLGRLSKLSELDWESVSGSARHSFGWETISKASMTPSARQHVPAGMDKLLVFRATGDNHVFLGYRQQNIFEVIFLEYEFGDIYSHG